jgi:internalin A
MDRVRTIASLAFSLAVLSITGSLARTPVMIPQVPSNVKIQVKADASTESRLIESFTRTWMNPNGHGKSLRVLSDYYNLCGQPEKLDDVLAKEFHLPSFLCGTVELQYNQQVLNYCKRLAAVGESDLAGKCIAHVDGILTADEDSDISRLLSRGSTGYGHHVFDSVPKVNCKTDKCVEKCLSYSGRIGIGLDALAAKKPELTPLKGCTNIVSFEISDDNPKSLELLTSLPNLTKLQVKLDLLSRVDRSVLARLTDLELSGGNFTAESAEFISKFIPGLRTLEIQHARLAPGALSPLARLKDLSELTLYICKTSGGNIESTAQLSSLKKLTAIACGARLPQLISLSSLEYLNLASNPVEDADLKKLATLSKLTELNLSGSNVTGAGLKALVRLRHLKTLSLGGSRISAQGLLNIACMSQLEEVALQNTSVKDLDVQVLSRLPRLKVLKYKFSTNSWLRIISKFPAISEVDLTGSPFKVEDLALLGRMKQLQSLKLPWSQWRVNYRGMQILYPEEKWEHIQDEHLAALRDLPHLKSIDAHQTYVSGTVFSRGFDSLESLNLSRCPVNDETAKNLTRLKNLKDLDLSWTDITGKTVGPITACRHLEKLRLQTQKIRSTELLALSQLKTLTSLDVYGTHFHLDDLITIKKRLNNCQIIPDPDRLEAILHEPPG